MMNLINRRKDTMPDRPRIKNSIVFILIHFCILLAVRYPAIAADYFVDIVNGCDVAGGPCAAAGDGSAASPWKTLHFAVNNYTPSAADTLYVLPGTYSVANGESNTQLVVPANLTIIGQPMGVPIIDGTGSTATFWLDNGVRFNSTSTGTSIQGVTIKKFSRGIGVYNSSAEIKNNILTDNITGVFIEANGTSASPMIINNLIYDDKSTTLAPMDYGITIRGIGTGGTNNSGIYHNTIDGGTTDGIYLDRDVDSIVADIKYNNITNFGGYGINYVDSVSAGSAVAYNNIYGNGTAYTINLDGGFASNNIFLDPGYLDPGNHDYHLPPTSNSAYQIPSGAGDPVTHDLDGELRILPYDIGCYEFEDLFTLTVTVVGDGLVTSEIEDIKCPGDCTETAMYGTLFTLTPTPGIGYRFDHWVMDGVETTDNPVQILMDKNIQVNAIFENLNAPEHTFNEQIFPSGTKNIIIRADNFFTSNVMDHIRSHWTVRREDRKAYYCDDYDPSFTAETETTSDLTSHGVYGLTTGMVYIWKVGYEDTNGNITWSDEYGFAVGDIASMPVMRIPGGISLKDYQMVSFPLWSRQPLSDLLEVDCDPKTIRLGAWDPTTNQYIECGPNLTIQPGQAYWLLSRNNFEKTPQGIAVTSELEVELKLHKGWNMIACPNARAYIWDDVQILESDLQGGTTFGPVRIGSLTNSAYIDPVLWRWENGVYAGDTVRMETYKGYWVKANRDNLFLKFPENAVYSASLPSDRSTRTSAENDYRKQFNTNTMETPPLPMGDDISSDNTGGCFINNLYPSSSGF